ncbi:Werner helicase interacting protein 1 [Podila epigama]|nr:Werner helicase interacting protein 1 [Podila epigama]
MAREDMSASDQQLLATRLGSFDASVDKWADDRLEPEAIKWLVDLSDGDGRSAINTLEMAIQSASTDILSNETPDPLVASTSIVDRLMSVKISAETVKNAFQKTHLQYDRQGDEHYNLISALHKSIRGSDVDASLYWLGRMLVAGEEPLYIARRLIRLASEDIGLADSSALPLAIATYQACQMIGMPECDVNLAHCVAYMAKAPKSVDVYKAYGLVKQTVSEEFAYPVPVHLRNAPTTLMKDLGYGEEYKYPPSFPPGFEIGQEYLPKGLMRHRFMGQFPVLSEEEAREAIAKKTPRTQ